MSYESGREHRIVQKPDDVPEELGQEPDVCVVCGYPFGEQLQELDPLHLLVPKAGSKKCDSYQGPCHFHCLDEIN